MKAIIVLLVAIVASVYARNYPVYLEDDLSEEQKNIIDQIINLLGLKEIWDIIVDAGQNFVAQFIAIGTQLIFATQQVIREVQAIINQLVIDLLSQVGDAATTIARAIAAINQILGISG